MPAFPAPDSSAMTDIWPTMARFSTFSPECDNPFSSSPGYSNGNLTNLTTARTMSDQSAIDSFKDRHSRLMTTENEKNKLIEVGIDRLINADASAKTTTLGPLISPRTHRNTISTISP